MCGEVVFVLLRTNLIWVSSLGPSFLILYTSLDWLMAGYAICTFHYFILTLTSPKLTRVFAPVGRVGVVGRTMVVTESMIFGGSEKVGGDHKVIISIW